MYSLSYLKLPLFLPPIAALRFILLSPNACLNSKQLCATQSAKVPMSKSSSHSPPRTYFTPSSSPPRNSPKNSHFHKLSFPHSLSLVSSEHSRKFTHTRRRNSGRGLSVCLRSQRTSNWVWPLLAAVDVVVVVVVSSPTRARAQEREILDSPRSGIFVSSGNAKGKGAPTMRGRSAPLPRRRIAAHLHPPSSSTSFFSLFLFRVRICIYFVAIYMRTYTTRRTNTH